MQAATRTGIEKTAIVLLALGSELGPKLLQKFSSADIKRILEKTSGITPVDKDSLELLVDEFAAQFAQSLGLSTGFDQVKSLVEQAFSPGELDTMLAGSKAKNESTPVWSRFEGGSENILVPYFLDEHPQTVAVILSRLDNGLAAKCFSMLPGDLRIGVAQRMLKISSLSGEVERLLEGRLEQDLLTGSDAGLEDVGRQRLSALLNQVDRNLSDGVMLSLSASRPDEARRLRSMIFSFEDIVRLDQAARIALFDKLPAEQVVLSLRGADAALKEMALSALGARARRMVEAELANDNGRTTKEGLAARRSIADTVLALAARGELSLPDNPSDQ